MQVPESTQPSWIITEIPGVRWGISQAPPGMEMPGGGGLKKSALRGGFDIFLGLHNRVAMPVDWVILLWYAWGADEQVMVTWLQRVFGWVDYHIFLGMRLCSRVQSARVELPYDLIDPCVPVLFIAINIYSPSLCKCATGSIVFSICTSYEKKERNITAKRFF